MILILLKSFPKVFFVDVRCVIFENFCCVYMVLFVVVWLLCVVRCVGAFFKSLHYQ